MDPGCGNEERHIERDQEKVRMLNNNKNGAIIFAHRGVGTAQQLGGELL